MRSAEAVGRERVIFGWCNGRGKLDVAGGRAGLDRLRDPVLAVANPPGRVVPPSSVLDGLDAMPEDVPRRVLQYDGERGPALHHLGPLVRP